MSDNKDPVRIVLTGGPCGGKTTALNYVQEKMLDVGFYPIIVPELPTLLIQNGITPSKGLLTLNDFENLVLGQMLSFEETALRAARLVSHPRPVIIHDRGLMDIQAYVDENVFTGLQKTYGLSTVHMRDARYDAVFHLRTAALGAEQYYTTENNKARGESLEEARETDERTLRAWNGHSHLVIIDNSTDFSGKMRRLLAGVCKTLGIPAPLEIERKFLLKDFDPNVFVMNGIDVAEIDIEQFYLIPSQDEKLATVRVRKRTQYGESIYWKTIKRYVSPGVNIETESRISADEYIWSKTYQLPDTSPITKKRLCFPWENQYFELDVFTGRHQDTNILEIELSDKWQSIVLPPFLNIVREVTEERGFSNWALAKI